MKQKIFLIAILMLLSGMTYMTWAEADASHPAPTADARLIEGFVVDESGSPIANAEVVIPEKNVAVQTGPQGRFQLMVLGGGHAHLEIYKTGFLPSSTELLKILKDKKGKIQKFILYPSPLEEVVVTGTSTPKLYRETPVKTSVASKASIERKGTQSLADSLEIVTGVRVEDNCQNCNFTQVRINGMDGKYSQILIDGMPVMSALAGVYALEQLPANMIEKLEVVKGGGSALYGGNAVAGVVNVVTRDAVKSGTRIALTQESIHDTPNTALNLNTDYVSKSYNTQATFYANYQRRNPMYYNDDDFSDLGELTNLGFGSNFSRYFENINGKLKLHFTSIFEDRRGGNKFELPEHMADVAEAVRTQRTDASIGWEQTFSMTSILKFNGSFSYTKRKSYYGSEQDPNAYGHTENPVFYTNLTYNNFSLKNHALTAGLSYRADKLDDRAPAYNRVILDTYTDLGFFIQDEISMFKDTTTLLVGVRSDKHSEVESLIVSPRVSLLYKGLDNVTFRATYSTGFRAPQVFDEDLHITQVGGEGRLIVNRDGLREEKSHSFTVGMDYGLQSANRLFQFSLGGFFNRIDGVFTLAETDASLDNARVFERFNSDAARVYGIEVEAGFKEAGKFEIFTGWTFQRSELEQPEPDFGSKKMFRSPDVYGSVRLDVDVSKSVNVQAELSYTGSMVLPHYAGYISEDRLEKTEPFVVWNCSIMKRFEVSKGRNIILTASVLNLTDAFQADLDKGIYRDAGYIYGPRLPRTFRVGLKYNF